MDVCPEPGSGATGNSPEGAAKVDDWFFDLHVEPGRMDVLWAEGWRQFGPLFFRYSEQEFAGGRQHILPLRIDLARFVPSKSQRRVLRRNADLAPVWRPAVLTDEHRQVFDVHAGRFHTNVPQELEDFLGHGSSVGVPCEARGLEVREPGTNRLMATSYVGIGRRAWSSTYAFFDPADGDRSLGIATQLWEIEAARAAGCDYLYLGYGTREVSHYEYKRQFAGAEWFDWTSWQRSPIPRAP